MRSLKRMPEKLSMLLILLLVTSLLLPTGMAHANPFLKNSAVQFLADDFLNDGMANNDNGVGSYALYVLKGAGVDVSTWEYNGDTFSESVINAVYGDISNAAHPSEPTSAKLLSQDLAAVQALEQDDLTADLLAVLAGRQSGTGFDSSLFSNIPAFDLLGRLGFINRIDTGQARDYILGEQNTSGANDRHSWGFTYGGTYYPDFIATAQAVRALHYLDPGGADSTIQEGITNALGWMKSQQQEDGSFVAGFPGMDDPLVDTCEAIVTMHTLSIPVGDWLSSADNSGLDYLNNKARNEDGSFGSGRNVMDATAFLYAYNLVVEEEDGLYIDPSQSILEAGKTKQLQTMYVSGGRSRDVTVNSEWSVQNSAIASIEQGLLTGLKAGQTVANAIYESYRVSCNVTVTSGSGSGGESGTTGVMVKMAVVGPEANLLYGPSEFSVANSNPYGLTVLGALDASGADYTTSTWEWGEYVNSVAGIASTGSGGWMYSVNGNMATQGAESCSINKGDKIVWYWATGMGEQPPAWSDLVKMSSSGAGGPNPVKTEATDLFSDTDLNAAIRQANAGGQIVLTAAAGEEMLVLSREQFSRISAAGLPLVVTVEGMQFVLSPEAIKLLLNDANNTRMIFKAHKLSAWAVANQVAPFSGQLKLAGDIYELEVLAQKQDGTAQEVENLPGAGIILPVPAGFIDTAGNGRVLAYRYNENSQTWEYLGGKYDADSQTIGFNTAHFSKYALLLTTATFNDVNGHWAQKAIEFMAANGYVSGVGKDLFLPDNRITRAEFVAIVTRMAGLSIQADKTIAFADIPADAWYREAVDIAVSNGIVFGMDKAAFAPDAPVSREQMAAILVRLLEKKGKPFGVDENAVNQLLAGITDQTDISSWARMPVAAMVREKLMEGRDNGCFAPLECATRAEAAMMLYRVLHKL